MSLTDDSEPSVSRSDTAQPENRAYIAELIEVALGEDDTIRQLNGCVARLAGVRAAKQALLQIDPAVLRGALLRHLPTGLPLREPR